VDPAWGGVALDRTLRTVDTLRFLTGEDLQAVGAATGPRALGSAATPAPGSAVPPAQTAVEALQGFLQLPRSRAVFSTFDAYLVPHVPPRIEVYGTVASAALVPWESEGSSTLHFYRHGEQLSAADATPAADLWSASVHAFVTAVEDRSAPPSSAADDVRNLSVCLALLAQAGAPTPEA
jgi:predicted dehydrogenase